MSKQTKVKTVVDDNNCRIIINKGQFSAEVEFEYLDEIVEGSFTIFYKEQEVKSDNICTECIPEVIQTIMNEIEALENFERILK